MKIAVLVSGGVDSSVALMELVKQGHDVTAFYLKIWLEDELAHLGSCPWQEDLDFVRAVCTQAGVPLEIIPLQQAYWNHVVAHAIELIKSGCTPNPDMLCNQKIKFGAFLDAIGKDFDYVASGHYAQVRDNRLLMSPDPIKDQTYFLARLNQAQLARALFPIGHLTKQEVRALASVYNLANKDRKDSQGICFLGKIKFDEFVRHHLGEKPGKIVELETDKILGPHKGFWFYTIGQRQGMGLSGGPWYVAAKNTQENIVYASRQYYTSDKNRSVVYVNNFNWLTGNVPAEKDFFVKLRHGPHVTPAKIEHAGDSGIIYLEQNDQGIAPGQFAVFYRDNICYGSAIINKESITYAPKA